MSNYLNVPNLSLQPVSEVTLAAPQTTVEEEDEEEESHFSEGQLLAASSQSLSDDSDQIDLGGHH